MKAELQLEPGERYLINPGSVGQPRDNDWRAAFAVFETNDDGPAIVTFYRVPYDVKQTQARIVSSTSLSVWRPGWLWADNGDRGFTGTPP